MPKNKMSDLRNHLFEALEALKDEESPMEIERAKAISMIAREINQSAITEYKVIRLMQEADGNPRKLDGFFGIEASTDERGPVPVPRRRGEG